MTAQRKDEHSTEFGLWLRQQEVIDSKKGYIATNVDYIWRNYITGSWMLIEEKRHMSGVKRWQRQIFDLLNWCARHHPKFKGFHVLQFENTSPDDGRIFWDTKEIARDELLDLLQFKTP